MFEFFISHIETKKNNYINFPTHKNKKRYKKDEEIYNNGNNIDCDDKIIKDIYRSNENLILFIYNKDNYNYLIINFK